MFKKLLNYFFPLHSHVCHCEDCFLCLEGCQDKPCGVTFEHRGRCTDSRSVKCPDCQRMTHRVS
jgi:hypothetical protein